jgi:ribonuclease HI
MNENPHAIKIHCDGAMDYDKNNTGGNGFIIDFPDDFNLNPVEVSLRRDNQGIHQLEMISILEAMDELIRLYKINSLPRCSSGVIIFTDRFSVPDLLNPFAIQSYRKNKWKNHEDKPIKDKELIDRIDKTRNKLIQVVGGRVEIYYKRRNENKTANRLSKAGKKTGIRSKKVIRVKSKNITKRLFDGAEIMYSDVKTNDVLYIRVYSWEMVGDMYEITTEAYKGSFKGKKIRIYTEREFKENMHRGHFYKVKVKRSNKHHLLIDLIRELKGKK